MTNNEIIPIPPQQDRSIDYKTYAMYCCGCPFLMVNNAKTIRNRQTFGSANPVEFGQIEPQYHEITSAPFQCGSPPMTFLQRITQEHSLIGVSWCPFLDQKFDTLYNVAESY